MRRSETQSTPENVEAIVVRLLPMGEAPKELTLSKDATVAEALSAGGYEGLQARVNGEIAGGNDILEDGDRVVISGTQGGKVKGGN
jgi:hypothetical protein